MESNAEGNDNFATKLISTGNMEEKRRSLKNVEEVRRKNQTYLLSKLLPWTTSSKVTTAFTSHLQVYFTCYSECMT